jgi:predicted dehydrogenase
MSRILKTAVIGLGAMGRGHVEVYKTFEKENFPVKLVAVCDIDEEKLSGAKKVDLNISGVGHDETEYGKYRRYTSLDELLDTEKELDYVDIVLPTYLHAPISIKAMEKGFNVMCEKPMALNPAQCEEMIATSKKLGKKLMIGQCLRFWPEYEVLKKYVVDGSFGAVKCAYFFRGGGTPLGSYENWLLSREKGGGALHDQHVHDTDMVNWLFGKPDYVSTSGTTVYEGSGHDAVSTNYFYKDGKVVNAQDDWTINGKFGFQYNFRVNFERGALIMQDNKLTIYPHNGEAFTPDIQHQSAYYRELVYFTNCIRNNLPVEVIAPESCADTIRIVHAEALSADANGKCTEVE